MPPDFVDAIEDYAIFRMGPDGHVTTWNAGAEEIKGYSVEEAIGLHFETFFPAEAVEQRTPERLLAHAEAEGTARGRGWRLRKDGSRFWADFTLTALYDDEGALQGFAKVVKDTTAQYRYEQQLERQNERLESFASRVSHDLKNPLNLAAGRLELAREECDSSNLDDAARALERSLDLVDGLLGLVRDERSSEDVRPVDLPETVKSCWKTIQTTNETLVVQTEKRIVAVPSRLQRIVDNLLANAVEHGGEGVTVTVGDLDDGFYVADSGVGIPADERDDVLERGYSDEDGTGLGLHIVKASVEDQGWDIRIAESDAGGARFEIRGVETAETEPP